MADSGSDAEIDGIIAALERGYSEMIIEFVTEVVAILKETTPFDTGHARANWIPSIGSPISRIDGLIKETKKKGRFTTAGKMQDAGLAEMLTYRLADGDAYVSNPVPYVRFLNYGTSDQAPANFFEAAVQKAISIVEARNGSGHTFTTETV